MHTMILVVAFTFAALTPFMHALPRASGDDAVQSAELDEPAEAEDESEA